MLPIIDKYLNCGFTYPPRIHEMEPVKAIAK